MSDESGYTDAWQVGQTTTFSRLCLTDGRKYLVIEQGGSSVKLDRFYCERVMEMADKFIPDGKVRGFGMAGKMTEGTTITCEFPRGWIPRGEDEHSQGRDKAQQGAEVEAGPAKEADGSSFGGRREDHSDQ